MKGVGESVRGKWSGDVDLNNGKLNHLNVFQKYQRVLKEAFQVGLRETLSVQTSLLLLKLSHIHT